MIYVFYRPNSEHERPVQEFKERLEKEKLPVELVDVDTRAGAERASAYGVMQNPSVLAVRDNGSVVKDWPGMLPTLSDVAFFGRSRL